MRIAMVAGHCCIRVQKMAMPLIERGHHVSLIGGKVPTGWESYKSFNLCTDIEQYTEAIKLQVPHVDVFHCHNEPSWFVTAIKEVCDVPVILDVHDSYLARSTPEQATEALDSGEQHLRVSVEERNNFQLADALVFPGDEFRKTIVDEFGLEQPALTLPSYVPWKFYCYQSRDWHGGLVYEGKVNLPTETKGCNTGFHYCDYTDVADRCSKISMDFHLYAARDDDKFKKHYDGKAFLHKPMHYDELMKNLGRHDWGLVGNSIETREWEVAMPNKMFEYLATGMPVVSMNAKGCTNFLESTGMGIAVSNPEDLGSRWAEHRKVRERVIKERKNWTMENHIHKLEDFYREVASAIC